MIRVSLAPSQPVIQSNLPKGRLCVLGDVFTLQAKWFLPHADMAGGRGTQEFSFINGCSLNARIVSDQMQPQHV